MMPEESYFITGLKRIVDLEGRRLAYLEVASHLEHNIVSTGMHKSKKVLVSKHLFNTQISDSIVMNVAFELRERALQLETERRRIEGMELTEFVAECEMAERRDKKRKDVSERVGAKSSDRGKLKLAVNTGDAGGVVKMTAALRRSNPTQGQARTEPGGMNTQRKQAG